MTADDLREQARQVRIFDELAVMISPDHAEALADLIDAVAAHKASFDSPNADVVVRARSATFVALAALDQEAST